jgi:effector-binding domain-containing protein
MKTYVTFGQIHIHSVNGKTFDKDSVAVIECENEIDGRNKAFEYFDNKFFTTYFDKQWNEKYLDFFPRGLINVNNN